MSNYYENYFNSIVGQMDSFPNSIPVIKLSGTTGETPHMNLNMDCLNALSKFIDNAKSVLNRRDAIVLSRELGHTFKVWEVSHNNCVIWFREEKNANEYYENRIDINNDQYSLRYTYMSPDEYEATEFLDPIF